MLILMTRGGRWRGRRCRHCHCPCDLRAAEGATRQRWRGSRRPLTHGGATVDASVSQRPTGATGAVCSAPNLCAAAHSRATVGDGRRAAGATGATHLLPPSTRRLPWPPTCHTAVASRGAADSPPSPFLPFSACAGQTHEHRAPSLSIGGFLTPLVAGLW